MVRAVAPTLLALASVASAQLSAVTRQGRFLVTGGQRYVIRGVAYQPAGTTAAATAENKRRLPGARQARNKAVESALTIGSYIDPLADGTACARDIPNLTTLGANTIRVYNVNGNTDHSACMSAFSKAGIRVIADLSLPQNGSINRAAPSWDVSLLAEYVGTLDNLAKYDNLLAVNIANEVVTSAANSGANAYIKAAARDIKAYIKSKNYNVLVGYSSADGDPWRTELANFLVCGPDAASIDLFGLNSYAGCGATSISPYTTLNTEFAQYPVAAYFSEFGCLTSGTRTWSEVAVIFGTQMLNIWSGGLAFEYFADSQGLGLTQNTTTRDGPITITADFTTLANQYSQVTLPTNIPSSSAAQTPATPACPSDANQLSSNNLPPTPNAAECACFATNAWSCLAKPTLTPAVVGSLLDQGCSLLAGVGGSCLPISSNGTTGVYGAFSACAPIDKLNYVLSAYYDQTNRLATSCDFAGNATINANIPSASASAAEAAATSSCQAGATASVFTPSAVVITTTAIRTGTAASGAAASGSTATRSGAALGSVPSAIVVGGAVSLFAVVCGALAIF